MMCQETSYDIVADLIIRGDPPVENLFYLCFHIVTGSSFGIVLVADHDIKELLEGYKLGVEVIAIAEVIFL